MIHLLFDVESTGFDPKKDHILSIGAVLYNDKNGKTSEYYQYLDWTQLFKNFTIPESSTQVHKITVEKLKKEGVHPAEAFEKMADWVEKFMVESGEETLCNLAFNIPFDLNFMHSNLLYMINNGYYGCRRLKNILTKDEKTLFIDPLVIDRILHFEVDGVKVAHNLQAVGERYGIPVDENAHDALADTRRTLFVWKRQMEELADLGIAINEDFEARLARGYVRNEERFKNRRSLDYFAKDAPATAAC